MPQVHWWDNQTMTKTQLWACMTNTNSPAESTNCRKRGCEHMQGGEVEGKQGIHLLQLSASDAYDWRDLGAGGAWRNGGQLPVSDARLGGRGAERAVLLMVFCGLATADSGWGALVQGIWQCTQEGVRTGGAQELPGHHLLWQRCRRGWELKEEKWKEEEEEERHEAGEHKEEDRDEKVIRQEWMGGKTWIQRIVHGRKPL